ncbi:myo-inosose-2 dehydratase [Carnobacterium maltaromaticum]|uniref:myo-inosose-2 dehydratase n=1 Tax=Carnobacterium maltaromaticum TaxID=2751 RepID=UPI000C75E75C|nr:myo-inosose-2 dehydratase [Carnobacterium maltaromaticum]PLS33986.1 myo-inosose-2 dehydratase [Carnobacterium maltaromaticum]PLS34122.1 myo-inosose-2 dehydratase [Carnobacterium maltaromaticum]PLS34258.1 myo-inosose-2 dehydratase [Carnobacterium maltaromaticum]PLS41585.1 myo-inosose-2 dehydratase [Carnobacterium maltaromaticum]PLS44216.1 myo-inosose-2 dehydratase [Carnobacterium maltaromaticum]
MTNQPKIKLGIAPIAWTNDDMPELGSENSFEQCISEMALAGFTGTEIGNKYPKDPKALQEKLKLRNLEVASAWFSAFLTTKPYTETAEAFIKHRDFLWEMGAKVIVVAEQGHSIQGKMDTPLFKHKPQFTDEEWVKLTEGLEALGELAHEKDMEIVYHHHMGTGVQTTADIDRLMKETDPTKVSLLFDTGHLVFSGENPLQIYKDYQDRIKHIHFKDIRDTVTQEVKAENNSFLSAVKQGAFTVPGDGVIDFKPIMSEIEKANYTGWIVVEAEQDPAVANPFEYALKARNYLKKECKI